LRCGDEFLQLPNKSLNSILKNFGLTEKYRAENIKHWVQNGYLQPNEAGKLVLESISSLADAEVIGAEVYKTITEHEVDQNTYWIYRRFLLFLRYYFSSISVDPSNADKIYLSECRLSNQMTEKHLNRLVKKTF
jgi:hypothetical protein